MATVSARTAVQAWELYADEKRRQALASADSRTALKNLQKAAQEATVIEELWITLEYQASRVQAVASLKDVLVAELKRAIGEKGQGEDDLDIAAMLLGHIARLQVAAERGRGA
ncbi:MAG: hypothetical protein AMXMBFR64_11960 [Myxococcales bacterium]